MLFGDPNVFTIETCSEAHLTAPSHVWGRMQLLFDSCTLGDINDEHCGLYGAYCGFKELLSHEGRLWHDSFNGLDDAEIHDVVRHAIYGDDDRTGDQIVLDAQTYRPFDFLTNWGEQFDGFASVIFQRDNTQTTVVHIPHSAFARTRLDGPMVSLNFSTNVFESAILEFLAWFERETQRLSG